MSVDCQLPTTLRIDATDAPADKSVLRLAYLLNQYPAPSQTFIRREIVALERGGCHVERFTIRNWSGTLVDRQDLAEQRRTRVVLDVGRLGLCWSLVRTLITRPRRFLSAAGLAARLGWGSDRGLLLFGAYLAEACVLLDWWAKSRINHVHVHFGTNAAAVALLCRELGGPPYSFTVHGPEEFDRPEALRLREKVTRAAFVVAISQYGRSQIYRWLPHGQWSKVHVVRCGLDAAFLEAPACLPPADRRLVCVARLEEQKGLFLLIEAAARVREEGLRFTLTVIGDGRMRAAAEQLIARSGLQDTIRLLGWKDGAAVREEILSARALVLPSFAEGLPVVIMEALALRRPVISTYVAGIPELVEPGISGWLVPPGAIEPLVAAMHEALTLPPEVLFDRGSAGARRVARFHSANTEAAALQELFEANALAETSKRAIPCLERVCEMTP